MLENIEEKNKLSVSRCKKIKSKEKEFLSVCQSGIIISIITIGFLLEKICEFIFLRFEVADDTFSSILNSEYLHSTKNIFIIVKTKIEINNIDICITYLCAPLHNDEILLILYYII